MVTVLRRRQLAAFVALAALGGCGAPKPKPPPLPVPRPAPAAPPPPPTVLTAVLRAQANVNPDIRGRPSPVTVRVYLLRRRNLFEGADFFALYERDKDILGADVVDKEELQLMPGDTHQIEKQLTPEVAFIGVFAAFRDLERAQWRSALAVIPRQKNNLLINLEQSIVTISRRN